MFSSMMNLPPPPTEPPPKPPRRVSTIMTDFQQKPLLGEESKQPMMKRLSRVLSVRRFSKEKKELSGDVPSEDLTMGYHLDAFNGKIGVVGRLLARDKYMVNQLFQYSPTSLLTEAEENNQHYIPPPPLPKLVRLTLRKPVQHMTVDQRWLLTHGFADSTLLHYACAGDQVDMVKYLLANGADWDIVNGANKTAEVYTTSDEIRTLLAKAEDVYKPLGRPSYTPSRTYQQSLNKQLESNNTSSQSQPPPAPPPSPPQVTGILKPGTGTGGTAPTGRRRQSIINDSSWADSNLRSTVHQTQVLNIRGSTANAALLSPAVVVAAAAPPTASPPSSSASSLKRSLSAKSTPIPVSTSDDEVEEETPTATIIPMRFASTPNLTMQSTANTNTNTNANTNTSTYSMAASIRTGQDPMEDLQSIASEVTAGTQYTGVSGAGGGAGTGTTKRLSFRRKSGVLNTLRSRNSVTGAGTEVGAGASAEPEQQMKRAKANNQSNNKDCYNNSDMEAESVPSSSVGKGVSQQQQSSARNKTASPQRQAVPTSSKLVEANKAKAAAAAAGAVENPHLQSSKRESTSYATKSKKNMTRRGGAAQDASTTSSEEERGAPPAPPRSIRAKKSKFSNSKTSEDSVSELPQASTIKGKGRGKSKRDADTESNMSVSTGTGTGTGTGVSKQSQKRPAPAAPVLSSAGHTSARTPPPPPPPPPPVASPLAASPPSAATAPPPIRMMRRLSMNMSLNAVEAVSYTVGEQGETVVSSGVLGEDSPQKEPTSPPTGTQAAGGGNLESAVSVCSASADSKAPSPRSLSKSGASYKSPLGVPRVPDFASGLERGGEVRAAGEGEYLEAWEAKLGGPPLERMQNSLLSGRQSVFMQADQLISRARALEKQEAREAQAQQARAEKMQAMLSKLTPLENIATGMLLRGKRTPQEVAELSDDDGEGEEHKEHKEHREAAERRKKAALESRRVGGTPDPNEDAALLTQAFHTLTFKEMIWRRAGYHMNAATTSDAHRSEYDRARAEAYKLGVKLLERDFQSFATKDRWEAVEMVEQHRVQEAERRLKELSKSMVSSARDEIMPSEPPMEYFNHHPHPSAARQSFSRPVSERGDRPSVTFVDRSNHHDSFVPFS